MTVCIATNLYYPSIGGVPNYYWYLAQNLADCGHKVIVLKPDLNNKDQDDLIEKDRNITVITLSKTYNKHSHYFKQFFRPGDYEAYTWIAMGYAMKEWLLKNYSFHHIDIIEVPDYGGLCTLLKDDRLPPVLVAGHSALLQVRNYNFVPENDHTTVLLELEQLSFKYADGIVAHSYMNQRDLEEYLQKKVFFARAPWKIPDIVNPKERVKGLNIVVSGLHFFKGAPVMAEAVRLIAKRDPAFKLCWLGGDTFSAPAGEKVSSFLAREYKDIWGKNFIWEGPLRHDAILEKTASAELAIIPSRWETFNYFALESSFLSTPLIMTDRTGSEYLFRSTPAVSIVPANSATSLANAYFAFVEKGSFTDLSLPGELAGYFSSDKIVEERNDIYLHLIGNKKNTGPIKELEFLGKYTTNNRKWYYSLRKKIKKLVKGN